MITPHLTVHCGILDTVACESEFPHFNYLEISDEIAIATYDYTEEADILKEKYDESPLNNHLIIQIFNTKCPLAHSPQNNVRVNVVFILKNISSLFEDGPLLSKETLDLRFNSESITQIVLPDLVSSHLSLLEIKTKQERISQVSIRAWAYQLAYSITETMEYLFVSNSPIKFKKIDIQKIKRLGYDLKSDLHKPSPTIKEMAKTVEMSPTKFKTIFKEVFRTSPRRYILNLRLNHAKNLIKLQSMSNSKQVA